MLKSTNKQNKRGAPAIVWLLPLAFLTLLLALGGLFVFSVRSITAPTPGPTHAISSPTPPQAIAQAQFSGSPEGNGVYDADAPLSLAVEIAPLLHNGDTFDADNVAVQLVDQDGQPAIFGQSAADPQEMIPGALTPDLRPTWLLDTSAPSKPGEYHPRLTIGVIDLITQTVDLPAVSFQVQSPANPLANGLVYPHSGDLWLLASDGAQSRRLTFYPREQAASEPRWSFDGQLIAFTHGVPVRGDQFPTNDIWQIDPRTSASKLVVAHAPGEALTYPTWTPDGKLLYTVDYLADPDTGATPTQDRIFYSQERWRIDQFDPRSGVAHTLVMDGDMADVSRDGSLLTYVNLLRDPADPQAAAQTALVVADVDNSNPRTLVPAAKFNAIMSPRIDPANKLVAFAAVNNPDQPDNSENVWQKLLDKLTPHAFANGVPWDIYSVPLAGGEPQRLTHMQADQPGLSWGSDPTKLAIIANDGIYLLRPGSDKLQKLAPGAIHSYLSWYDH